MAKNQDRSEWNSLFGFMMAMIGSAVGLGNIWRFPNVLYSNGGGSFMIPYIVALFLLGISFILVEYALGYRFKASVSKILYSINNKLEPVGWVILVIIFLILTYYVCVIGWDLIYLVLSFFKGWGADPSNFFASTVLQTTGTADGFLNFVPWVLGAVVAIWAIIFAITQSSLNKGIEAVSKILIPLLCVMVAIIVFFALTLPGAAIGYTQIFTPDWNALANPNVWLAAFGQIVFSLSLGMAIALTYASYLPKGTKITDSAITVAFSNSAFEIFNAFGVFSILGFMALTSGIPFDNLISEGAGTGLAFIVFPQVFNMMGDWAYFIGPLFFACIFFAGLTSAMALVEPISSAFNDKFGMGRKKASALICGVGLLISLLFTTQAGSYFLGIFDAFLNNIALLLTIVLECIIFAWIYNFDNLIETMNENTSIKLGGIWKTVIKYILPLCILVFWISGFKATILDADFTSQVVMLVLTLVIIVVPLIITKLPAKKDSFYEVLDELKGK